MRLFHLICIGHMWYKSRVMARRKRASYLSKQAPASVKQRIRRILIWLGILAAALLLICTGGYLFFMSWLQGDSFRRYLSGQLARTSGARTVDVPHNLTVDGGHMTLPEFTLQEAPFFRSLSVQKLHLEVDRGALLSRWLKFRHFSVEALQITLGKPTEPLAAQPEDAKAAKPAGGFLKGIQAPSFKCENAVTSFVTGENDQQKFTLSGYKLSAIPKRKGAEDAWTVKLENGRILTPFSWLRTSGLENATILYQGKDIRLQEARILLSPGKLNATGHFNAQTGLWKARLDIDKANVARILNADWKKRLTGELCGYVDMEGEFPAAWQAAGSMKIINGKLEGLPILSDIELNGSAPYRTLTLEEASCTLRYPYAEPELGIRDAWLWDNINIRAKGGALLVKGRVLTGMDGSLSGALTIGIPARILAELGLSKSPFISQLFNAPVAVPGYVWLHVNLSGTLSAPQEDLSVRLATILPQALPDMAERAVKSLQPMLHSFLPPGILPAVADDAATDEKTEGDTDSKKGQKPDTPEAPAKRPIRNAIKTGMDLLFH